jgi:hypothetical protein
MGDNFDPNYNPLLDDLFNNPFDIPTSTQDETIKENESNTQQEEAQAQAEGSDLLSFSNIMNLNSFTSIQNLEVNDEERFNWESQKAQEDEEKTEAFKDPITEPLQDWEVFQKELDFELQEYERPLSQEMHPAEQEKEPEYDITDMEVDSVVIPDPADELPKNSYCKPPEDKPYYMANTSKDQQLFIPMLSRDYFDNHPNKGSKPKPIEGQGYIGESIYRIIQNIEDNGLLFQSKLEDNENYMPMVDNSKLWVDRYNPKEFIDLTGDDRLNRMALSWLKIWDFCVFNKRIQIGSTVNKTTFNSKFKTPFISWEDQLVPNVSISE